jgi:hypothetical protein
MISIRTLLAKTKTMQGNASQEADQEEQAGRSDASNSDYASLWILTLYLSSNDLVEKDSQR